MVRPLWTRRRTFAFRSLWVRTPHPNVVALNDYVCCLDGAEMTSLVDTVQRYGVDMHVRGWTPALLDEVITAADNDQRRSRGFHGRHAIFVSKIAYTTSDTHSPTLSGFTAREIADWILTAPKATEAFNVNTWPTALEGWAYDGVGPYLSRGLTPGQALLAHRCGISPAEVTGKPTQATLDAWALLGALRTN